MLVHVRTDNHIGGGEKLAEWVKTTVEESLRRFGPQQVQRVEVHLSDENSHKNSSADKKCTLEARLAGLQPVAVSDLGAEVDQALDGALDKLGALLDHKLGRLSDRKGQVSMGGDES